MNRKKSESSTPIRHIVRESLGLIQKNIVSGKVKFFNQCSIEFEPKAKPSSPPFHSDLSVIKETSSIDSGYDSNSFRRRSKSFGARSIQDSVLDSYAKYPNFKWSHLKYFGVDPKEYLSQYNIDLDTIDGNASVSRKITADIGNDDNNEVFHGMRERSKTFSAKRPGGKIEGAGLTKKRSVERDRSTETLINAKLDFTTSDLSETVKGSETVKSAVKKSIQTFEANGNVRGLNEKPTTNIADLKLRIRDSIKAYNKKCELLECKESN